MKLIDADALRKDVSALPNCYNGFSDAYDKSLIIGLIDEQIVVDAIPVVRCKDCQYMTEHYDDAPYLICSEWDSGTEYDGYCSYGERRSDERVHNIDIRW